jgi:hypothetical protein
VLGGVIHRGAEAGGVSVRSRRHGGDKDDRLRLKWNDVFRLGFPVK